MQLTDSMVPFYASCVFPCVTFFFLCPSMVSCELWPCTQATPFVPLPAPSHLYHLRAATNITTTAISLYSAVSRLNFMSLIFLIWQDSPLTPLPPPSLPRQSIIFFFPLQHYYHYYHRHQDLGRHQTTPRHRSFFFYFIRSSTFLEVCRILLSQLH